MSDEGKLKHGLNKYKNPDVAKREILNVIQHYKGLNFVFDSFIFNDGSCMDLVNLSGTIPVVYRGSTYNIPVCIWLMDTHPTHAPLCFVKPTSDMSIKVSKYVDNNGKVYLPILHDWASGKSNLISLIRTMIVAFGEIPPVYAKPPNEPPAVKYPYPTQSFIPQPDASGSSYMPYPMQPSFYPPPQRLPYPSNPYPPNADAQRLPYPSNPYPEFPADPSRLPYPMNPTMPTVGNDQNSTGLTIEEKHIKASLYSAIEDKIRRRMREQYFQNQAELDTLKRTQQELTDGQVQLNEILNRLKKESNELDKNIGILKEKEQELEQSIDKLSEQDSIDPDDAVTTTTPLYNQLLNAFAEEATTEDAIYYMGEALRTGVIDLDAFLKQVRALSRKQFTLRALMQKCRQKAGLAC